MTNQFRTIAVIDDDAVVRDGYGALIEAVGLQANILTGPLEDLNTLVHGARIADAAITDYNLAPRNYATFDGAQLVAAWYQVGFPAVLCTAFRQASIVQLRQWLRWIPVIIAENELSYDLLIPSLEVVEKEIKGEYIDARRPWRAQVHFVDLDSEMGIANAVIPSWSQMVVPFKLMSLPPDLQKRLHECSGDLRCHASVNIGAEANEDLYAQNWEL